MIDIRTGEILCEGLSMPHSPRIHGGELWVLNSGTGELGVVAGLAKGKGRFEPRVFCPGFLRGLAFHGNLAIVGLSKPRYKPLERLALDERLRSADGEPWRGLLHHTTTRWGTTCLGRPRAHLDRASSRTSSCASVRIRICPPSFLYRASQRWTLCASVARGEVIRMTAPVAAGTIHPMRAQGREFRSGRRPTPPVLIRASRAGSG